MRRLFPFAMSVFCLFLFNFQCEDDNPSESIGLETSIETSEITISAGDTIWFNAMFSTAINASFSITESGGLATIYTFALDSATNMLTAAEGSSLVIDRGARFQGNQRLDPAGHYFTYQCPDMNCDFRVGIVLSEAGLYLLKPEGLGFETNVLDPDIPPSSYAFTQTWIINRPDYNDLVPWLNDRSFQYQLEDGNNLFYSLDAFNGPVFIEVE